MSRSEQITRYACYLSNATMAVVSCFPPLLFLTFHNQYGISFSMLGALILVNFSTQLCVDLIFSFFSHRFPIAATVRTMPLMTVAGFLIYTLLPQMFPGNAYLFLVLGTVVFSASAGLGEVLISPLIAALPSANSDRDMSRAHSVYAWSVAVVVPVSTLYLHFAGIGMWYVLALIWMVLPLAAFVLFLRCQIPDLQNGHKQSGGAGTSRTRTLVLCVLCIFLGGACENTMSQWCSSYLEVALGIPKLWGDIFGVTLFAVMLALGRTLYARFGKHIFSFLLVGFTGAFFCYVISAVSSNPAVGLTTCVLTGICVSMLWPGTLIGTAELIPDTGVVIYAMLAAGGDLGGSVVPQLTGAITDAVSKHASGIAGTWNLTAEQLGFKTGMLVAALFPLLGIAVSAMLKKKSKKCGRS